MREAFFSWLSRSLVPVLRLRLSVWFEDLLMDLDSIGASSSRNVCASFSYFRAC